jgi:response regulator RpfG family c-di-GMP phosphodiesterase
MSVIKRNILVVDDQKNWRELLSDLLEDEFHVYHASNVQDALAILSNKQAPILVLITDIRLVDNDPANQDGLLLVDGLNETSPYTKTIVVTGYPSIETVKKAIVSLRVFDYIEKYPDSSGFESNKFCNIVRSAVEETEKQFLSKIYVFLQLEETAVNNNIRVRTSALTIDNKYRLLVQLQDVYKPGSTRIDLSSIWDNKGWTQLKLFIFAEEMKLLADSEAFWDIPLQENTHQFTIELIPKVKGTKKISVDLEHEKRWLGRIEKEVKIVSKQH